jgi:hypothetical protein
MNCDDVRDAVRSGRDPTGPELERHLADCESCAELLAGDDLVALLRGAGSDPAIPAPPSLGGALDRIRSVSTPGRVALVAAAVGTVGILNAVALLRTDASAYPALRMAVILAAFTVAAVLVGFFVLWPVHLPRPDRRVLPVLLATGILLPTVFAVLPAAHDHVHAHPESFEGRGDDFWSRAIGCLIYGTVSGLPTLVLLFLLGRGGKPRSTVVLGALLATALAGNVALQLHCPLVSHAHLLVGHAGVPLLLVLVGLPLALRRNREARSGRRSEKM